MSFFGGTNNQPTQPPVPATPQDNQQGGQLTGHFSNLFDVIKTLGQKIAPHFPGIENAISAVIQRDPTLYTKPLLENFAKMTGTDKPLVYKDSNGQFKFDAEQAKKSTNFVLGFTGNEAGGVKPGEVGAAVDAAKGAVTDVANAGVSSFKKLLSAIDEAGVARNQVEKAYTAERAARASKVSETFSQGGGQTGYFEALGKLKGGLAPEKQAFESLKMAQPDVDNLFNQIQGHPSMDVFDKVSASAGLQKIFEGQVPQKSQLSLLEDVFGKDIVSSVMDKRSFFSKAKDMVSEVLNVPRALITSFDMSAPLRQGVVLTTTQPKAAAGAFGEMFKQAFSQKNFDAWLENLPKTPEYPLMKDSGLYISNPNKISGGLGAKEEKFMTNLAEKIPVIGPLVKASERSYVGFLNKLRVDSFKNISAKFIKDGITPADSPEVFKSLANFVNNASGRGDLGSFERVAQELNTVFFSPRLIASRFNMLNPLWYAKQAPPVRSLAIKSFAEFVGIGSTVLTLAKLGGADVELDPRSTDFGKIKVGNTRWDIWGGFQQWVRVFSQLSSGQVKTTSGKIQDLSAKKFPFQTRKDVAETFLAGKLAPIPGLAYELLQGQKLFGQDITVPKELFANTVPLYLQDMQAAIKQFGPAGIFEVGGPSFFGVGTQTYQPTKKSGKGSFR